MTLTPSQELELWRVRFRELPGYWATGVPLLRGTRTVLERSVERGVFPYYGALMSAGRLMSGRLKKRGLPAGIKRGELLVQWDQARVHIQAMETSVLSYPSEDISLLDGAIEDARLRLGFFTRAEVEDMCSAFGWDVDRLLVALCGEPDEEKTTEVVMSTNNISNGQKKVSGRGSGFWLIPGDEQEDALLKGLLLATTCRGVSLDGEEARPADIERGMASLGYPKCHGQTINKYMKPLVERGLVRVIDTSPPEVKRRTLRYSLTDEGRYEVQGKEMEDAPPVLDEPGEEDASAMALVDKLGRLYTCLDEAFHLLMDVKREHDQQCPSLQGADADALFQLQWMAERDAGVVMFHERRKALTR